MFKILKRYLKIHGVRYIVPAVLVFGLAACDAGVAPPTLFGLEVAGPEADQLIFSEVKGLSSDAQQITLTNVGGEPLALDHLALAGADAQTFTLDTPSLPLTLAAGSSATVAVAFAPDAAGTHSATLQIGSGNAANGALSVALYGLASEGEQGANEPPLQQVVATLGYSVDVGGDALELGSTADAIGDEQLVPLFEKAGSGPVTLEVVARYGPEAVLPYGFFTLDAARPVTHEVGQIASGDAQELLPPRAQGALSFDPGALPFGIYGQAGDTTQYSLDGLNTGAISHALRVYPLRDRSGNAVANSYLIGLEEAQNGDYQDVLFVLTNVHPAGTTLPAGQPLGN